MLILIPVALLGWIPFTLGLFLVLPPRRAAVISLVGGWLLLPPAALPVSGLPDYDKMFAASAGILLGTLIFQPERLLGFRPRWYDLPMLCWCIAPFIASMANGLGPYDACSAMLGNLVRWGLPYLIGRLYFGDPEGLRELAVGIVVGGLAYIVPILLEVRLSPFFKSMVYGIRQWEGSRYGAYRPWVFLSRGLELGMWMTAASLTAIWLWRCRSLQRVGPFAFGTACLPALLVTTVLCRSAGALALLLGGLLLLWLSSRFGTKIFLYCLLAAAPTYYAVRIPGYWSGENLVALIRSVDATRAQSLEYRFQCEELLIRRAMLQPAWGWGGWGRNRVVQDGQDVAPTDGLWIINLGTCGLFGLISWTTVLILPVGLFLARCPLRQWRTPAVGPMAALAVLLGLYTVDCLFNAFINLIYIVCCGGLAAAIPAASRRIGPGREGEEALPTGDEPGDVPPPLPPQERLAERYLRLARTLGDQGAAAEARSSWGLALDLLSQLAAAHPGRADLARKCRDCANDLAWFLLTHQDPAAHDPPLAWHFAHQAVEADPECAAYWNTLGVAAYRMGDAPAALAALERSIALGDGGTAFDYLFLALAHEQLGQHEQARYWAEQTDSWIERHASHRAELARLRSREATTPTPLPHPAPAAGDP